MKIDAPDYRHPPQNREITNAGDRMCTGEGGASGESARHKGLSRGETGANATRSERRTDELAGREAGTASTAGATTAGAITEAVSAVGDADFEVAYEVLYHGSRRDWLFGAHRWALFLAIVFGASAATSFGGEKFCGLLAALAAAADMAFDFVGRGQAHADIRRRYLDLMAAIVAGDVIGDVEPRRRFPSDYMEISADEPPLYRWAAETAHHNACVALGRAKPDDPLKLWQRALAHIWRG